MTIGKKAKTRDGRTRRFEMKKAILRGPSLTQSGYGVHCRQVASWLLSKKDWDVKFQALPWGDTPWLLNEKSNDGLIDRIMKNTVDLSDSNSNYDISFQLQLPNEWDHKLAKYNVGMTAGIETDICNPVWIDCCNKMDLVIVPSKHAENSLKNSGKINTPIQIVPESFCNEILDETSTDLLKNFPTFSTNTNFLVFGQITGDNPMNDRKNIFFTIKWFCEVFKDDPDVGLVIKTNIGRNTQIDKKKTLELMSIIVKECRKSQFPKIHIIHGDMTDKEVAALYKHPQINGFISLTRGEGYGLPLLEAAASGLPVIATGWSGHMDFLSRGKFIEIDHDVKKIHASRADNKLFMPEAKWAEANEDDFKKKIVKFKNSQAKPKEWAKELELIIKENYSQESIFKYYDKVVENI